MFVPPMIPQWLVNPLTGQQAGEDYLLKATLIVTVTRLVEVCEDTQQ
jgi:hypothetical protein